jgi:excisionase family DNA binding protein
VSRMQTHTPSPHTGGRFASASEPDREPAAFTPSHAGASRLLAAEDVAEVVGVPRTFVYELARRGELPAVRVGERYIRFRSQPLQQWIADRESTRPKGAR